MQKNLLSFQCPFKFKTFNSKPLSASSLIFIPLLINFKLCKCFLLVQSVFPFLASHENLPKSSNIRSLTTQNTHYPETGATDSEIQNPLALCFSTMILSSKKSQMSRQSSHNSLHLNHPLNDQKHNRSSSDSLASKDSHLQPKLLPFNDNKENKAEPNKQEMAFSVSDKENIAVLANGSSSSSLLKTKQTTHLKSLSTGCKALKPSSLQFCMQMNEPDKAFGGFKLWDPNESDSSSFLKIWDYSDSEASPASSWSTLPNKSLLFRPLPLDIGKCTCVIVKEVSPEGSDGGTLYSLYTNEGHGRQDRKLAVAKHKRHHGRSEFVIAQNMKGLSSTSDDGFFGIVTSNFMGSKYQIWDQGSTSNSHDRNRKSLLAVALFTPTITTWTGSYRSMKAYVPKHQSVQLKNNAQVQHIKGLPKDWEGRKEKVVDQLFSRAPHYNKISKQYELDFRERGRAEVRIQRSVKNFQLTMGESGKQTILQLGRVEKTKYVMDYRYPLTGYQAFCICLASIDPKLCCTV